MTTTVIKQSESYPKYFLVNRPDGLHVALKTTELPDWDDFFSVGQIADEENFESACDAAEEEFRCLLAGGVS